MKKRTIYCVFMIKLAVPWLFHALAMNAALDAACAYEQANSCVGLWILPGQNLALNKKLIQNEPMGIDTVK